MNKIYDVLVIGSGGAGLSAALEAKKYSQNILVVSKTDPTSSQTSQAQGGINAVLNSEKDSISSHIKDTIKAGCEMQNNEVIHYMCENAKETIQWLDELGVPFSRDEYKNIAQRNFGGASYPRTCYSSDYTGLKILHTLYEQCIKENLHFLTDHLVLNFIKDENTNTIKGIHLLNIITGKISQIFSKSIIIASGGYAGVYDNFTTNSTATTGEMISIALDAGCELENMEFIQFHPTSLKESRILISESARGEGGYLIDQDNNRFIDELKPRDEVARAIYEKIENGDKVYLDLRHLGLDKIQKTMPQEYQIVRNFTGLSLDKDIIEITPSAHYTMGGIKVDLNANTNINNLFACGECASNKVHGANRLGGNSLLEIVTFGKLAGKNAGKNAKKITYFDTNKYTSLLKETQLSIEDIYNLPNTINYQTIKKELGEILFKNVGLFREELSLNNALESIKKWIKDIRKMGIADKSKVYNTDLKEFLEFQNILTIAHIIIHSAIQREESRGAHYRKDYLEINTKFRHSMIVLKTDNNIGLHYETNHL